MTDKKTNIIAICLFVAVFLMAYFSVKGDSLTMDELSHIPAGYSYVTQHDMRINPEHPPIIKDLAGIPLLFIQGINFPHDSKAWKDDINGQWDFGATLLFKSNNPADSMIFWARIPMIFMLLLLGFFIFKWSKELFGNKAALIALFLFSFSPTLLAHGRLVTTDVGAATGFFIATYYFVKYLKERSGKNLLKAGLAFGFAQLLKFSAILLFPVFGLLVLAWLITKSFYFKQFLKNFFSIIFSSILICLIAIGLIWVVYQFHTWNYPPERQVADTQFILKSFGSKTLADGVTWMADKPGLRPIAQYLLGLFMVLQRAVGGNTTYFLGEVSASGWLNYFPVLYAVKEPLAFFILAIIALLSCALIVKKPIWEKPYVRMRYWFADHLAEFAMILIVVIYWLVTLKSNLNIGVRHLIPVIPPTIVLVSCLVARWLRPPFLWPKRIAVSLLLLWQAASVIFTYPHFISYFNEIAGGSKEGYVVAADSNLDWGQDLKRLKTWVDKNKIDKIYIDYFGGADAKYYFKDKMLPWWGTRDPKEMPSGGYLAVSATFLDGGRGQPVPGFDQDYGYYNWLNNYNPITIIGNSIFVYKIE